MKKSLFLALLFIISATCAPSYAQSRWGVTLGGNYNEIHFKQTDIFPVDKSFGFTGGVSGELMFSGVGFGFGSALLYTQRRGTLHLGDKKVWSSNGIGTEDCTLHYLDIPIDLKFRYRNMQGFENTLAPMVFAGPMFSFLVGHSNVADALKYKTLNVMMRLGAGFELFNKVQIAGSYNFSIGEALRTKVLDDNIAKNRCWTVTATYMF